MARHCCEQGALCQRQAFAVGALLLPAGLRMTPDYPYSRTRRVDQHAIEALLARKHVIGRIARDDARDNLGFFQTASQHAHLTLVALDARHRAFAREPRADLQRFVAASAADVEHDFTRLRTEHVNRHRRTLGLHPPLTLTIRRQRRTPFYQKDFVDERRAARLDAG